MSEEINKHEIELNSALPRLSDAELAGVSGGVDSFKRLYESARAVYCYNCDKHRSCGHSAVDLANYMLEHGDINGKSFCPFR